MARILILNCTPQATETSIVKAGSRPYEALIRGSLDRHLPKGLAIEYIALRIADRERLPQGLGIADFDGVWISGSPLNVYELDQPTVREQIELTRELWEMAIPAFGSCWGLQLMTAALGGTVQLNPRGREIGIARRIVLTDDGRANAMFVGKPQSFDALCSHEDEIAALPTGGSCLASNSVSRVQAAEITIGERSFWGVQYHPEFEFSTVAAIIAMRTERHLSEGLARTEKDVAAVIAEYMALDADPRRKDLAWKHGLGEDVLDPIERTLELGNWLKSQVMPFAARR